MTTNNPNTLPAREAAQILGLAPSTLAKLRLFGNGPAYCKLGRRVVYRREDVETWLASRIARNTSDADARLPKSLTGQQPSSQQQVVGSAPRATVMSDEPAPRSGRPQRLRSKPRRSQIAAGSVS
jgi:predicted DNA-binding transcriptional regulator AlpA